VSVAAGDLSIAPSVVGSSSSSSGGGGSGGGGEDAQRGGVSGRVESTSLLGSCVLVHAGRGGSGGDGILVRPFD
jgi:hypothetical protein